MEQAQKQDIIKNFARSESDVGSTEVQVALLTSRITEVTEHLRQHRQDHGSRRGLIRMVNRRRELLDYLNGKDHARYVSLIDKLGLRR